MSKRTKKDKRPVAKIDFKPYGAAIKAGRTKQKESRNKAADALFISPRYLANIENKGQHPSVQVFLELMSRYHISVDQILHGETMEGKSFCEGMRARSSFLKPPPESASGWGRFRCLPRSGCRRKWTSST